MPIFLKGLSPSNVPIKTLHALLFSPIHAMCATHLILLDLAATIIFGEDTNHKAPHYEIFSILLLPPSQARFLSALLSKTLCPHSPPFHTNIKQHKNYRSVYFNLYVSIQQTGRHNILDQW
jgi:hypothetical protein